MKPSHRVDVTEEGLRLKPTKGDSIFVRWEDIQSIELSTFDAFSSEVDYLTIGLVTDHYVELNDYEVEGFKAAAEALSEKFDLRPDILSRYPCGEVEPVRIFDRNGSPAER